MNADDMRSYNRRWEMVAEVEQREFERMSPAARWLERASVAESIDEVLDEVGRAALPRGTAHQGAGARRGTEARFARHRAPRLSPKAFGGRRAMVGHQGRGPQPGLDIGPGIRCDRGSMIWLTPLRTNARQYALAGGEQR